MATRKLSDLLRDLFASVLFELAFAWIRARAWVHSEVAGWRRAFGWGRFAVAMAFAPVKK